MSGLKGQGKVAVVMIATFGAVYLLLIFGSPWLGSEIFNEPETLSNGQASVYAGGIPLCTESDEDIKTALLSSYVALLVHKLPNIGADTLSDGDIREALLHDAHVYVGSREVILDGGRELLATDFDRLEVKRAYICGFRDVAPIEEMNTAVADMLAREVESRVDATMTAVDHDAHRIEGALDLSQSDVSSNPAPTSNPTPTSKRTSTSSSTAASNPTPTSRPTAASRGLKKGHRKPNT